MLPKLRFDIKYLHHFCGKKKSSKDLGTNIPNTIPPQKDHYRTLIRSLYVSKLSETFVTGQNPNEFGFPLKFRYQRSALELVTEYPADYIYPHLDFPQYFDQKGLFTSCGQVATASVLEAFRLEGYDSLKMLTEVYWESRDLLQEEKWKFSSKSKLAYLDSSCLLTTIEKALGKASGIKDLIVDTTCWGHDEPILTKILKWAKNKKIRLVFIRSSIKLDCLGMEYGRLGSVLWLFPKSRSYSEDFLDRHARFLRLIGGYASTSQLYPFWLDRKFHTANNRWIKMVKTSNREAGKSLESYKLPPRYKLKTFPHGIYNWVIFPADNSNHTDTQFIESLIKKFKMNNFEAAHVASHPADYVGITCFKITTPALGGFADKFVVRISLPPLSKPRAAKAAQTIKDWVINERP